MVFIDFWLEHTFLGVLPLCSFKASQLDLRHESWRTCWVWLTFDWHSFNVETVCILDHKVFNVLQVFPGRMSKVLDGCSEFLRQLDATWRNQGLEDLIDGLQPFFEDDVGTPSESPKDWHYMKLIEIIWCVLQLFNADNWHSLWNRQLMTTNWYVAKPRKKKKEEILKGKS